MQNIFPFHYQDRRGYCGPGCVLMAMDQVDPMLLGTESELSQERLYEGCSLSADRPPLNRPEELTPVWYSSPDGIESTMNQYLSYYGRVETRYEVVSEPMTAGGDMETPKSLLLAIVRQAVRQANAPAFITMNANSHWVLITDFAFQNGRWEYQIYDPGYIFSENQDIRTTDTHNLSFTACATCRNRDFLGDWYTEAQVYAWLSSNFRGSLWRLRFLAIIPRVPGAITSKDLTMTEVTSDAIGPWHQLAQPLQDSLAGAETGASWQVIRLDNPDAPPYRIVEVRKPNAGGELIALLAVDTKSNKHFVAKRAGRDVDSPDAPPWYPTEKLTLEAVRTKLHGKEIPATTKQAAFAIDAQLLTVENDFGWEPCLESHTPLRPFYILNYNGKRLYMDLDGNVLTRLSTEIMGM